MKQRLLLAWSLTLFFSTTVQAAEEVRQSPPADRVSQGVTEIFPQRGILTPRNGFVIEPSLQFGHASTTRVSVVGYTVIPAVVVGLIDVRKINRDTVVAAISGRYGITDYLEGELRVPYVYRNDSAAIKSLDTAGAEQSFNADGQGVGDVEFGLRYQFNKPAPGKPYIIGGLRIKTDTGRGPFDVARDSQEESVTGLPREQPTGTGFWGIQPSVTFLFPSDPMVFFGSLSYMANLGRDVQGVGDVDPGDIYGFNLGWGLGVNERVSLSLGYDHNIIGKNRLNGRTLGDTIVTHVGSIILGYSYRSSDTLSVNFSLGFGVTEAAQDVTFALKVPMKF